MLPLGLTDGMTEREVVCCNRPRIENREGEAARIGDMPPKKRAPSRARSTDPLTTRSLSTASVVKARADGVGCRWPMAERAGAVGAANNARPRVGPRWSTTRRAARALIDPTRSAARGTIHHAHHASAKCDVAA